MTAMSGFIERYTCRISMKPFQLDQCKLTDSDVKVVSNANTGSDDIKSMHMLNWMELIRIRNKANARVEGGHNHSITNILTTAALRTGEFVTFDEENQEVLV